MVRRLLSSVLSFCVVCLAMGCTDESSYPYPGFDAYPAGDLDGDGVEDVLLDVHTRETGESLVALSGDTLQQLAYAPWATIEDEYVAYRRLDGLRSVGDVDSDGRVELLMHQTTDSLGIRVRSTIMNVDLDEGALTVSPLASLNSDYTTIDVDDFEDLDADGVDDFLRSTFAIFRNPSISANNYWGDVSSFTFDPDAEPYERQWEVHTYQHIFESYSPRWLTGSAIGDADGDGFTDIGVLEHDYESGEVTFTRYRGGPDGRMGELIDEYLALELGARVTGPSLRVSDGSSPTSPSRFFIIQTDEQIPREAWGEEILATLRLFDIEGGSVELVRDFGAITARYFTDVDLDDDGANDLIVHRVSDESHYGTTDVFFGPDYERLRTLEETMPLTVIADREGVRSRLVVNKWSPTAGGSLHVLDF